MELREVLDGILRHKVENPKKDFTEEAEGIIDAVKAILTMTMDEDGKVMAPKSTAPRNSKEEQFCCQRKQENWEGRWWWRRRKK